MYNIPMTKKLKLKDEFNTGKVTMWSPHNLLNKITVPDGTEVQYITNLLNGYLVVKLDLDVWEVFQNNVVYNNTNLN